jgi:isopentenyl diphosphate isomerase/L-lactate dehydrogenase-like FMN-dependent dehydrogenase
VACSKVISLTVGIGRPFLYAFSSYGQDGVEKALEILRVCLFTLIYVESVDNIVTGRIRDEYAIAGSADAQGRKTRHD